MASSWRMQNYKGIIPLMRHVLAIGVLQNPDCPVMVLENPLQVSKVPSVDSTVPVQENEMPLFVSYLPVRVSKARAV